MNQRPVLIVQSGHRVFSTRYPLAGTCVHLTRKAERRHEVRLPNETSGEARRFLLALGDQPHETVGLARNEARFLALAGVEHKIRNALRHDQRGKKQAAEHTQRRHEVHPLLPGCEVMLVLLTPSNR